MCIIWLTGPEAVIKMLINYTKTKEMILGNANSNPPPPSWLKVKQEAQLMLTTGSTRLAVSQSRSITMALLSSHSYCVVQSYEFLISVSKIEPLFERRTTIGKLTTFFNKMCHESNCLNHLLPDKRDPLDFERKNETPNMLSYSIQPYKTLSVICALCT